jgi:hypothetical protein
MKYRKKPVVIEAEQYRKGQAYPLGVCCDHCLNEDWEHPHVHTIHNNQAVLIEDGDFIIPEPDGVHFYPCKPDIFEATYEPAYPEIAADQS